MGDEQKRNGPAPVYLGMFICDHVITDIISNKRSIIGIFDQFQSSEYPSRVSFTVFARVTDGEGEYRGKLEIVHLEDDKVCGMAEGPMKIKDRMSVHDLVVQMSFPIPKEGTYEVRLYVDGAYLGRSVFRAVVKAA